MSGESAGRAAVSADAVGQHRRPDDAGVGLPPSGAAAAAARGCAEHPHRAHRRRRAGAADAPSAARSTPPRSTAICDEGISYNRFHTTAMCSPTRASLLTGRNHHRVGNGQIAELANDWDGYSGHHPEEQRPGRRGAQELRLRHRGLGQVAQHARRADHRRRARSTTGRPAMGFEYFYGFLAGEASQYEPNLVRNTTSRATAEDAPRGLPPERGHRRRRHRLAAQQKAFEPDKPFFMYWASGACTARTTSRRSGPTSTKASSTTAGTSTASAPSRGPRSWAGSRQDAKLTPRPATLPRGTHPRGREAVPAPADGGVRRLHRARRRPGRPDRSTRSSGSATATTR